MLKTSLIGIAAVAATIAFVAPASAQHRIARAAYAQTNTCADHEPGNPYSKDTDYMGWSAWRVRGGWDASNDYNCLPGRMSHTGF